MSDSIGEVFSATRFARRADESGLVGRELAARLGVHPTTLSAVRNGRSAPSMELLVRIVGCLGGTPADYLQLPDRSRWSLRLFRMAAGLTQLEVSEALGVAPAAVSGWETQRYRPALAVMPSLAELYGATLEELEGASARQGMTAGAAVVTAAKSVVSLAEIALDAAAAMSGSRRRDAEAQIRERLEASLDALGGVVRELPQDGERAAVVEALRRLSELHATIETGIDSKSSSLP